MTKNLEKATELLNHLKSLIDEETKSLEYTNSAEITSVSRKLLAMKLNDEFFNKDLTNCQKQTLNLALIIANLK